MLGPLESRTGCATFRKEPVPPAARGSGGPLFRVVTGRSRSMSADSVFRRLFGRTTREKGAGGIARGAVFLSHAPGRAAALAVVHAVRRAELGIRSAERRAGDEWV